MGLDWLAEGVDFHITVDYVDLTGEGSGGECTTYSIADPEIMVIAANPVGGAGIGVDPAHLVSGMFGTEPHEVPCHGISRQRPTRPAVGSRHGGSARGSATQF